MSAAKKYQPTQKIAPTVENLILQTNPARRESLSVMKKDTTQPREARHPQNKDV